MKILKALYPAVAILAAIGAVCISRAQSTDFSTNHEDFVNEMNDLFKITSDKKRSKEFIEELKAFMESEDVTLEKKHNTIAACNALRKRKAKAYPDYFNCVNAIMAFDQNKTIPDDNYRVWHTVLMNNIADRQTTLRKINTFLRASKQYADDNTLNQTPSLKWMCDTRDITFVNDDNTLVLDIPRTRLVCYSQNDSIEVFETYGKYNFSTHAFDGEEGTITWERVGLSRDQTIATFGRYKIDMDRNNLKVDSVKFRNTNYFSFPLYGSVEHKVTNSKTTIGKLYPKFRTAYERHEIKSIFQDIDYIGGFTQQGATFIGSGSDTSYAEVNIYRHDTLFINVKAQSFKLTDKRVESDNAKITIKLDDSEITHPSLLFRYINNKREVHLVRLNEGLSKSLYEDTYHMVSMDIEQIRWNMNKTEMELGMITGAATGYSLFESLSYYREEDYYAIQGMAFVHPFQEIADFYKYNGGVPFTSKDFAYFKRIASDEIRQFFATLSFDGFIDYDPVTDIVTPKPRMFDYLKFRLRKKDYDVIRFQSETPGNVPNGTLDLKNYNICLNGVTGIAISDYQNVALFPDNGQVILKRNRDFQFDGAINAGMIRLEGSGLYFSYNDYRIELNRIERMRMKVISNEVGPMGEPLLAVVGNTVSDLSGYLEIDEPDNKSGNRKNPQYPRLTSTKESYVYFDDPKIQNGAYKRDRFHFKVDPFTFENINHITFNNTSFDGVLTTGIFPDIRQKLVVRDVDNSLGFVQEAPPEGYPVYQGRATFYNKVDLSNRGLLGIGDLRYIKSLSRSDRFLFLPDEANGYTKDFNVEHTTTGVTFPSVELGQGQRILGLDSKERTGQTWLCYRPYEDNMDVSNTIGKFNMFSNSKTSGGFDCILSGTLSVRPDGLHGTGRADLQSATLEAEVFDFTDHTIDADTSYFSTYRYENGEVVHLTGATRKDIIKDYSDQKLYSTAMAQCPESAYRNDALREDAAIHKIWDTDNITYKILMNHSMVSTIDFAKREGYFTYKSGAGNEWTSKSVRYKTTLQRFTWDIDRNLQIMGQKGSKGNRFVCTKERGDSLNFFVPIAIFYGDENILRCEEVKEIKTADARVLLNTEGKVTIHKDAVMDPLEGTKIELKTPTSFHSIYNSKVTILGAKKYTGMGDYDFINKEGKKYTIFMNDIKTDKNAVTSATGIISQDMEFDRYFAYKGKATILAGRQLLEYNGGARMIHTAPNGPNGYVRFNSVIDPEKVEIPIGDKITNWDDKTIYASFYMRKDSIHAYSSFLEFHKDHSDIPLLSSNGILYHNNIFNRFDITSRFKRINADTVGTRLSFIPSENAIAGNGAIDLGIIMPKEKPIAFTAAGDIYDDRTNNAITISSLLNIEFFFSDELATMLYNDIRNSEAPACDSTSFRYEQRMAEIWDTTHINYVKDTRWMPLDKETDMLPPGGDLFTLDNVHFTWHTPKKAYICDTIVNLTMMRYRNVNKKVRMKAELVNSKAGSKIDILLQADDKTWVYMGYKGNNLQIVSSSKEFNTRLQQIDPKERRNKSRGIFYTLAPDSRRKRFLANFGIKQPAAEEQPEEAAEESGESFDTVPDDEAPAETPAE